MKIVLQFRHQIKRGLEKTPCCKHRIKTARQRDDDVIDKAHHQMYASTASISHNNGIQLTLEQALAPGSSSGSTSSTGTASSGEQPLNGKVGSPVNGQLNNVNVAAGQLNNAFYLNNLRSQPPPPPYVNNHLNRYQPAGSSHAIVQPPPASLPASVRATPTADFELYPRHLRTHSYTQATQPTLNQQIHNPVQSTPSYRKHPPPPIQQYQLRQLNSPNILSDQRLYDKIHGRQSSSSAGS